jgi:hypothetical protein
MLPALLHTPVEVCERGEHKKEERVGRRVQREIKEAVNHDGETSGERACCYAAPENISGLPARKARAKEHDDEEEAESDADNPRVGHHL